MHQAPARDATDVDTEPAQAETSPTGLRSPLFLAGSLAGVAALAGCAGEAPTDNPTALSDALRAGVPARADAALLGPSAGAFGPSRPPRHGCPPPPS